MAHYNHDAPLPEPPGVPVDQQYQRVLQERLRELLNWKHDSFPGSQPVSFDHSHLQLLETEDYFVCEKSDGIRYLMFMHNTAKGPATFLIDRKNSVRYVKHPMFPVKDHPGKYQNDTLVDGELVLDVQNEKRMTRFLVFDLMVINGVNVTQRSFSTRLGMVQQDVIQPLHSALKKNPEIAQKQAFSVDLKRMERSYGLKLVFDQIRHLKHGNDGLIFTPVKRPYQPGTCQKLLKWKPADQNTVDFRIQVQHTKERKPYYILQVAHNGNHKFYDHLQLEPEIAEKWRHSATSPDGRVGEFWYDPKWPTTIIDPGYAPTIRKGGWRFLRFRDDKETANDEAVVRNIMRSIEDAVSREELEAFCDQIRSAWKAREKPGGGPPLRSSLSFKSKFPDATGPIDQGKSFMTPSISPFIPSPSSTNQTSGSYFQRESSSGPVSISPTTMQHHITSPVLPTPESAAMRTGEVPSPRRRSSGEISTVPISVQAGQADHSPETSAMVAPGFRGSVGTPDQQLISPADADKSCTFHSPTISEFGYTYEDKHRRSSSDSHAISATTPSASQALKSSAATHANGFSRFPQPRMPVTKQHRRSSSDASAHSASTSGPVSDRRHSEDGLSANKDLAMTSTKEDDEENNAEKLKRSVVQERHASWPSAPQHLLKRKGTASPTMPTHLASSLSLASKLASPETDSNQPSRSGSSIYRSIFYPPTSKRQKLDDASPETSQTHSVHQTPVMSSNGDDCRSRFDGQDEGASSKYTTPSDSPAMVSSMEYGIHQQNDRPTQSSSSKLLNMTQNSTFEEGNSIHSGESKNEGYSLVDTSENVSQAHRHIAPFTTSLHVKIPSVEDRGTSRILTSGITPSVSSSSLSERQETRQHPLFEDGQPSVNPSSHKQSRRISAEFSAYDRPTGVVQQNQRSPLTEENTPLRRSSTQGREHPIPEHKGAGSIDRILIGDSSGHNIGVAAEYAPTSSPKLLQSPQPSRLSSITHGHMIKSPLIGSVCGEELEIGGAYREHQPNYGETFQPQQQRMDQQQQPVMMHAKPLADMHHHHFPHPSIVSHHHHHSQPGNKASLHHHHHHSPHSHQQITPLQHHLHQHQHHHHHHPHTHSHAVSPTAQSSQPQQHAISPRVVSPATSHDSPTQSHITPPNQYSAPAYSSIACQSDYAQPPFYVGEKEVAVSHMHQPTTHTPLYAGRVIGASSAAANPASTGGNGRYMANLPSSHHISTPYPPPTIPEGGRSSKPEIPFYRTPHPPNANAQESKMIMQSHLYPTQRPLVAAAPPASSQSMAPAGGEGTKRRSKAMLDFILNGTPMDQELKQGKIMDWD
ncbi:uncharacterized protein VTP21DRAFT_8868 [Calcarisporiella thermophila]|uniref:uncharacterized protein n=1 Tax=Calcarisporiella thermophila TaxID=911321 RepID=UPI0037426E4D